MAIRELEVRVIEEEMYEGNPGENSEEKEMEESTPIAGIRKKQAEEYGGAAKGL